MLHITFPPTSHSAPILLTATLMQEVVTTHEKFLKVCLPVAQAECSHMGKANLPENAASAKQCQADSKKFHSLLLPLWFF